MFSALELAYMTSHEIGSHIVDELEKLKDEDMTWDEAILEATDGEPGVISSLFRADVNRIEAMRKYFN
jgi:hypothetical protein